jgi:hypothetical protein
MYIWKKVKRRLEKHLSLSAVEEVGQTLGAEPKEPRNAGRLIAAIEVLRLRRAKAARFRSG